MFRWNRAHSPLKKNIALDHVGNAALYLLSDLSAGVTGEAPRLLSHRSGSRDGGHVGGVGVMTMQGAIHNQIWKFFTGTQRDLKARPGKVTTARKQALESRQRWRHQGKRQYPLS